MIYYILKKSPCYALNKSQCSVHLSVVLPAIGAATHHPVPVGAGPAKKHTSFFTSVNLCNTCDAVRAAAFVIGYVSGAALAVSYVLRRTW